jgi:hypothetical protein
VLLAVLALVALVAPKTRGLAGACLTAAIAWTLLVSFNGAARFQNYRYYVPAAVLLLFASAIGVAVLARTGARAAGAALALAALAFAVPRWPAQVSYFARASRNIHEQQVAVGRKLAATLPPSALILVGDAGAIPYFSERHAVDALGLGGFHREPFASAAPHGEGAVLELLERTRARPTHFALYPNWFPALTTQFAREIDHVTIADNVICGGPTKGIYVADWSLLEDPENAFDLDVGDVESERAHDYQSPAPEGGFVVTDVRKLHDGRRTFDAGRVVPEGAAERFRITWVPPGGASQLVVRLGADSDAEIGVEVSRGEQSLEVGKLARAAADAETWEEATFSTVRSLATGDVVTLVARKKEHRTYHVRIEPRR